MSGITVEVRGLGGVGTFEIENGSPTVEDVRAAAQIAESLVLRLNGQTVSDESSTSVEQGAVLVAAAPEAKHGQR